MSGPGHSDDFLETGGALADGLARSAFGSVDKVLEPGQTVGRVRILEAVGKGGMGHVYRGLDERLDRQVAIKTLRADHHLDSRQITRLLQEARILSKLDHPGINRLFDLIESDDRPYLVLEYVDGRPLSDLVGELDETTVLSIGLQIADALAAAHRQGVVHRDLKPANVMMTDGGAIKILDFGIGRLVEEVHLKAHTEPSTDEKATPTTAKAHTFTKSSATSPGAILGTPWFMSPEQARGEPVTPASDLFSLGLTLCALVTGRSPITSEAALEAVVEAADGSLAIPDELSPALRRLVVDITRRESTERPTAGEAAERLRQIIDAPSKRKRMWLLGASVVAALAAVALALGLGTRLGEGRYRCRDFERHLDGVWDAERRSVLGAAFAGVGAQGAFETTARVLDAYAREWTDERTTLCESTWMRGEQSPELLDLEYACFDRRLQELASLVSVLAEDPQAVRNKAAQAAHALTPVSVCLDAQRLFNEVPLPDDEVRRSVVNELRQALARVKALYDTGGYEVGFDEIVTLRDTIENAAYAPLSGEYSYLEGLLAEKRGDLTRADASLQESILAAMEGRDDRLVAEAWIRRLWINGPILNDIDAAATATRFAVAAVERIGSEPLLEGALANHRSVLADILGDDEHALQLCREALRLRQIAYGGSHPKVASTMMNCGLILLDLEREDEALRHVDQAFRMQVATLGPDHPAVYVTMNGLASTLDRLGRHDEAAGLEQRTIELVEQNYPPDHPQLGLLKSNLANRLLKEGRYEEAQALAAEGAAILSANLGATTIPAGDAWYNLARANEQLADWDQAMQASSRAAAAFESLLGLEDASTIRSQALLGKALFKNGHTDRAIEVLETAMAAGDAADIEHRLRLFVRFRLAEVLIESERDVDRGLALMQAVHRECTGSDDAWLGEIRVAAARYLEG